MILSPAFIEVRHPTTDLIPKAAGLMIVAVPVTFSVDYGAILALYFPQCTGQNNSGRHASYLSLQTALESISYLKVAAMELTLASLYPA